MKQAATLWVSVITVLTTAAPSVAGVGDVIARYIAPGSPETQGWSISKNGASDFSPAWDIRETVNDTAYDAWFINNSASNQTYYPMKDQTDAQWILDYTNDTQAHGWTMTLIAKIELSPTTTGAVLWICDGGSYWYMKFQQAPGTPESNGVYCYKAYPAPAVNVLMKNMELDQDYHVYQMVYTAQNNTLPRDQADRVDYYVNGEHVGMVTRAESLPSGIYRDLWGENSTNINKIKVASYSRVVGRFVGNGGTDPQPETPIALGTDKQIFIDPGFIRNDSGVSIVVNKPQPTGERLIAQDKPWETVTLFAPCVIQEEDKIRMWYKCSGGGFVGMAYAYSEDDGKTWIKPNLGVYNFKGSYNNNIIMNFIRGTIGTVFRNRPDAPADQKYCMFVGDETGLNEAYTSPDGIQWTATGPVPFLNMTGFPGLDSQNCIFWDEDLQKYVAYPRLWMGSGYGGSYRVNGYETSSTFGDFTNPFVVFAADPQDQLSLDPKYELMDFYTFPVVKYPYAAGAYVSFPAAYYHLPSPPAPSNDGPLNIQFAASTDGITWHRYDRSTILISGFDPPGILNDNWEDHALYVGIGLTRLQDELSIYYVAYGATHGAWHDGKFNGCTISRAVYRLDGFTSVDTVTPAGGEFTTPPLTFSGDTLVLNLNVADGGLVRVEIQDASGQPVSGFTVADCDALVGDSTAKIVSWNGQTNLSSLKNTVLKLRFMMRGAKLYAFRFPTHADSDDCDAFGYLAADLNRDCIVDVNDFVRLADDWLRKTPLRDYLP